VPGAGLPWYLVAARRLVVEQGFDPHELASRAGTKPDLDDALEDLMDEVGQISVTRKPQSERATIRSLTGSSAPI
jgi:hypothetical protein